MSQPPDALSVNARAQARLLRSICQTLESLIDVICIVAALPVAAFLYQRAYLGTAPSYQSHIVFGLLIAVGYLCIYRVLSKQSAVRGGEPGEAILCWIIAYALAIGLSFWLRLTDELSRVTLSIGFVLTPVMLLGGNFALQLALKRASEAGAGTLRRAGVIVMSPRGFSPQMRESLSRQGFVISFEAGMSEISRSQLSSLIAAAGRSGVDQIFLVARWDELALTGSLSAACVNAGCPVDFIPAPTGMWIGSVRRLGRLYTYEIRTSPLSDGSLAIKRIVDISVSTLAVFFLWPLLATIAAAVALESKGNPIFRQRRRGLNGAEFLIFKFRTMTVREDGDTIRQAERNDPRVTHLGKWLRRSSLDELPQLFNVLMGSMSLVGPRPHAIAHDEFYGSRIHGYALRHRVKPGITGWAQVNGCRGETRDIADMRRRCEHDIWYSENWSFALDIWILIRTSACAWANEKAF